MALFDFLKRKKDIEKTKERQIKDKPKEKSAESLDGEKTKSLKSEQKKSVESTKKVKDFSYNIIKEPHISEKSNNLSEKNQYTFKVVKDVNKMEIKKSVEGIYGVDVKSVNVLKIPKKKRRLGRTEGFKKGYVKAIVTVKEGQKINII